MRNIFKKASPEKYIDATENVLVAYRCHATSVERISPVDAVKTAALSDDLFQESGHVEVDNHVFDLRGDGLYRFYKLGEISQQRIVCNDGLSSLLQMIGYLWNYGNKDDFASLENLQKILKSRIITAGCGTLARVSGQIFKSIGIQTRLIAGMSKNPWNGQDDGHTLLEIKSPQGNWFVYDPSFHRIFNMPLIDVCRHRPFKVIHLPGNRSNGGFVSNNYHYDFWIDERLLSEQSLNEWYSKVLDVPLIHDGEMFYYPESFLQDNERQRFSSRYIGLSEQDFRQKFYPEEHIS